MTWGGFNAAFGSSRSALALYRIALGSLLLSELLLRYNYLHVFYTDEGTLPMRLLDREIDPIYRALCVHCYSGSMVYQQIILGLQCLAALSLIIGFRTRGIAIASWFLYFSITLRNTWLAFILDRYFHYLLFYAMFLPLGDVWSVDSLLAARREKKPFQQFSPRSIVVSVATCALKLQVFWIYLDAGSGKYMDPLGGWTYHADPLPALDTYARHTVGARYLYGLLGPSGLRLLTPTVVYVELGVVPLAFLGSFLGNRKMVWTAVGLIWSLHLGIATTLRNTVLLSLVANSAWCIFLPPNPKEDESGGYRSRSKAKASQELDRKSSSISPKSQLIAKLIILTFMAGSVWFETVSAECNQSMRHIWSTLLHNRWNVFVGAEEYVTWEIAPGKLADGSVVDVWGRRDYVDWDMPGSGTPCTSTARPGRWRSFPYLAELDGEAGDALWSYLCRQWDSDNGVEEGVNEGRRLLRYNFFMLQADVLPEMGFSATRKRLVHTHHCVKEEEDHGATTSVPEHAAASVDAEL